MLLTNILSPRRWELKVDENVMDHVLVSLTVCHFPPSKGCQADTATLDTSAPLLLFQVKFDLT